MARGTTPSQTVGPFFSIGMERLCGKPVAASHSNGTYVTIRGRVIDGDRNGVPDALLEAWQAVAADSTKHGAATPPISAEFCRAATNDDGAFEFTVPQPAEFTGADGHRQAPHIAVSVFMRGLLKRLVTRVYFPGHAANSGDHVLNLAEPGRRQTLIARPVPGSENVLEWNVILQGAEETVFFDF